jgi:hypothetical protein
MRFVKFSKKLFEGSMPAISLLSPTPRTIIPPFVFAKAEMVL